MSMLAGQYRRFWALTVPLSLSVTTALAQIQPPKGPPPKSIVGTVEAISRNVIYVQSGLQLTALSVDDRTEVWKGKVFHDLSQLEVGDDLTARYRTDASGKLVADAIWLNIVNVFAVITKAGDNEFEVFTNPNADPQSAYKKEDKFVTVDADTTFEASRREDLIQGRNVQVVGLNLKNGTIQATRVTVYEGNRPVRMGTTPVTLPNGQRR